MATLPPLPIADPTLEAADRALEAKNPPSAGRPYLGMSELGAECERQLWLGFRWCSLIKHDAETLKRFADGHYGEALQAERLQAIEGVTLLTFDPDTGSQFGFSGIREHLKGHMDGAIVGLIQAPKTWHVWEHKQVGEKKFAELTRTKEKFGEKNALAKWNSVYYAQAVLYMSFSGMDRHYLTCSTPGGRATQSIRTNADEAEAIRLLAKADRVINAAEPPPGISADPSFYLCRWCDHAAICHRETWAPRNCRTCLHSTPVDQGQWTCDRWGRVLTMEEQREGCGAHKYVPALVAGEVTGATDEAVMYKMWSGVEWTDSECPF
jgi:hypothetical protein